LEDMSREQDEEERKHAEQAGQWNNNSY
jgi:hypothetical protein